MLNAETKRKIDSARDILVGKVPDPKAQVEQITTALIYKFMDDMDKSSEELGGKSKFFANGYDKYAWTKLMDSRLGGQERLNLYVEAITSFSQNPNLPQLFRDIFKNAFLPYRDAETLNLFLKELNGFSYDHSEDLGDAFEYLLSVLGSQGDAGQFRTPRHIIDFIVEIIAPTKDETVCDPACGTAGFLISAYKHILANPASHPFTGGDKAKATLTPDEKKKLMNHFVGYDISPDMVRLSKVNMYLHKFPDPTIHEYDTLTSEDKWNDRYDVILANPPFMSPKGGIKPHNRFSVESKRSEVLFVDYMAEHLTPKGRAGVIVPEGIIFQSGTAYRALRKMLVEDYLVAVISLPAGVFNPYSGVKTSILILDKSLARQSNTVGFFKIENDGFGLGAQRRAIEQNDLPQCLAEIRTYLKTLRTHESFDNLSLTLGHIVSKEKIAANEDFNLSGERYKESASTYSHYPIIDLSQVAKVKNGFAFKSDEYVQRGLRIIRIKNVQKGEVIDDDPKFIASNRSDEFAEFHLKAGDILMSLTGNVGRVGRLKAEHEPALLNQRVAHIQIINNAECLPEYLFAILNTNKFESDAIAASSGIAQANLSSTWIAGYKIPLPPLEIQKEIVAEIEGYQKIINGARAVVENYRPHIPINPDWPMVELGEENLFDIESGGTPSSDIKEYWNGGVAWATLVDLPAEDFITEIFSTQRTISELGLAKSSAKTIPVNSIVVSSRATIGRIGINRILLATNQGFKNIVIKDKERAIPEYIAVALTKVVPLMETWATGGTFKEISKSKFAQLQIPLPPLETQQKIVAEIEAEQALVKANRELIVRFEKKIQNTIARIWGEGD